MHNLKEIQSLSAGKDERERMWTKGTSRVRKKSLIPFFLLLTYLFLEYDRPQSLLPFLGVLRLSGITIVLLILSVLNSEKDKLKGKETNLFLLLLGLMVIHGPIAVNNYWALMYFITMAMNFVVYLSMIQFVDHMEKYERLFKTWLLIHLFLMIIVIIKHGKGIGGFLGDENDICMTLNMIIPFSFFFALNEKGKNKAIYFGLTCVFLFSIIITQSRGGFVGLVATGAYCWYRTKRKIITLFLLVVLAVFALLIAPASYWNEVRSITEEGASKGTGAERFYTWGVGWQMFLENPILGVGQGNFPFVFREYEIKAGHAEEGYRGRSVAGRAAHSIYFTMLPELGIVGTCLFFGMVFYILKDLKTIKTRSSGQEKNVAGFSGKEAIIPLKNKVNNAQSNKIHSFALALEGSLISFLVSGVFISTLYYPNFWVLMGFVVSLKKIVELDAKPTAA